MINITQGYSAIKDHYEKSIGYKGKLLNDIENFSADVNIGHFNQSLVNSRP